jgi:hypothetical protein
MGFGNALPHRRRSPIVGHIAQIAASAKKFIGTGEQ